MNGRKLAATLLVPFVALACAEQGQQGQQGETSGQAMSGGGDTAAAAAKAPANQVSLSAKNQSGITGTASWQVMADSATFTLKLKGVKQGQQYPAHVHQGNCKAGGGVAAALSPVAAMSGGSGKGSATVARSNFSTGQTYFVQVHLPDGTPAACGDLPKDAGLAPGGGQGQM